MATMHAREVFFAAFGVFCGRSTAPLTGPAYVLQRLQRFELSRVDGHVSGAYIACGRKTFLITISVRFRYCPRVAAALHTAKGT